MIWHSSTPEEIFEKLAVSPDKGLLSGVAEDRLSIFGRNALTNNKKDGFSKTFLKQLNNKWFYILLAVLVLSTVMSAVYGKFEIFSPLLIIAVIVANTLISSYYRYKSASSLERISSFTNPTATVIRDGLIKHIPSDLLVPGDIVLLNEGDYITADARIIECSNFRCNEITLSGEVIPKEKFANEVIDDITPLKDRINMVFSGASVLSGSAKAIVVETGHNTEFGKTAVISDQTNAGDLPVKATLDTAGNIINITVLIFCFIAFVIAILKNLHTTEPFATMTLSTLVSVLALGIAAIPESLPAVSTIVVALGIERILRDNIIIKKTKSLENLGKTNIICADKTGILTKNTMYLNRIFDGDNTYILGDEKLPEKTSAALRLAALCSSPTPNSTETAIELACSEYNDIKKSDLENLYPCLSIIPFDSVKKTMTTINMIDNVPYAIVKGAPEVILDKCSESDLKEIGEICTKMATEGLRVICVAIKKLDGIPANPNAEEIECDLNFVSALGIKDPPRSGAVNGVKICDDAGIRTIMMTGDSIETATAIARQIGILKDNNSVISGEELNNLSDEELFENIESYSVFARITPSDKTRIIKAWQAKGKIVTVTGDNIEDGDALSTADIGCAMGKMGTDVARGNADIIIEDNNFITLVNAIKESRGLFDNIRKSIAYLLSCNLSEILIYIVGLIIFGFPPLLALQLLWINLLTDCSPSVSLATERPTVGIMKKKQNAIKGRIFDFSTVVYIISNGLFLALIGILSFVLGINGGTAAAMTMAFLTITVSQILHSYNLKTDESIINIRISDNKFMNYTSVIVIFIAIFLSLTPAGFVFGLTVLSASEFFIALGLSVTVIPFSELLKLLLKKYSVE